ncbi:MAG: hypothetical protein ACQKBV_09510 [Puniceicoccales bacterium]
MPDNNPNQPLPEASGSKPERKPWPLKYIAVAIVLFIALFNLYTYWTAGS